MALENVEIADPFLAQGVRYIADGYDRDFIRDTMERDRDNFLHASRRGLEDLPRLSATRPGLGHDRHASSAWCTMFANMSDPSKLGPAMATALLATLYGALIANLVCLPLADKLHLKLEEEDISRSLIIDGILLIRDAKSPTLVREMLIAYLPRPPPRTTLAEAA